MDEGGGSLAAGGLESRQGAHEKVPVRRAQLTLLRLDLKHHLPLSTSIQIWVLVALSNCPRC